jgi:hypothetical protein
MSLTGIAEEFFLQRQKKIERHINGAETLQHEVLQHLLLRGTNTEYGRKHIFGNTKTYDEFVRNVPLNTYEELKEDIDRMRHGEANVLWPGVVRWYAKSSGTTNDKSKFIPVSQEGLQNIHYAGGRDVVAVYLRNNPKSRLFDGKSLILAEAIHRTIMWKAVSWETSVPYSLRTLIRWQIYSACRRNRPPCCLTST